MESLTNTPWDVIISGTSFENSLLALALSRSTKKILHIDPKSYYGDVDAAFSLLEAEEWADQHKGSDNLEFRNATIWKAENEDDASKLSWSRAYTLALSPKIIHSKSRILSKLISSKVYRQLEFQAVGNWWIFDVIGDSSIMKKIPNGREDIFQDSSIDNRSKRSLIKFLKFVIDYENQVHVWKEHAGQDLEAFLSSQFQLPICLHKLIAALTLTIYPSNQTTVGWALPRISQHLKSQGVLGPGFGSVIVKWGCNSEILQAACRASAVGGTVYMLGTGIEKTFDSEDPSDLIKVQLSNGCLLNTKHLVTTSYDVTNYSSKSVSRIIAITSLPLEYLFKSNIDGAPLSAVAIVVFPPGTLAGNTSSHRNPVYIMVHSSESGECPCGQYVLYATSLASANSKNTLETSISKLLCNRNGSDAKLLFSLYFEYTPRINAFGGDNGSPSQPIDLAFDDEILNDIEAQWQAITACDESSGDFLTFEERQDELLDCFDASD